MELNQIVGKSSGGGAGGYIGRSQVEELWHIIMYGQNIAFGKEGDPPLSAQTTFRDLMFSPAGVIANTQVLVDAITGFAPMQELGNETISTTLIDGIRAEYGARYLVSTHADGGQAMATLKKGTAQYDIGMQLSALAVEHVSRLVPVQKYVPKFILFMHGERDNQDGTTQVAYQSELEAMQKNISDDLAAITGEKRSIPMFLCQMSSWTWNKNESPVTEAQLQESVDNPNIFCVCPKYFIPHPDGVNLINTGYQLLGQYYTKAILSYMRTGAWEPLRPISLSRSGATITVTYNNPVTSPLVIDTTAVTDPLLAGTPSRGFRYTDDSASAYVDSVALGGAYNEVDVILNTTPTGANKQLTYAATLGIGPGGGPTQGPRGNIRNSDSLPDWCVHWQEKSAE